MATSAEQGARSSTADEWPPATTECTPLLPVKLRSGSAGSGTSCGDRASTVLPSPSCPLCAWPHASTRPSASTASEWERPAERPTTEAGVPCGQRSSTGVNESVGEPPEPPAPHPSRRVPPSRLSSESVCAPPAAIIITPRRSVGSGRGTVTTGWPPSDACGRPSAPLRPQPQPSTAPPKVRATEWRSPAAT
jgi:hypothetical protein